MCVKDLRFSLIKGNRHICSPFPHSLECLRHCSGFQDLLQSVRVITDEQRRAQVSDTIFSTQSMYLVIEVDCDLSLQNSGSEGRVDPDKHRKAEFLCPETTKDFERLLLEFSVSC